MSEIRSITPNPGRDSFLPLGLLLGLPLGNDTAAARQTELRTFRGELRESNQSSDRDAGKAFYCDCGYVVLGSDDVVVDHAQRHFEDAHDLRLTRRQALAMVVEAEVSGRTGTGPARRAVR